MKLNLTGVSEEGIWVRYDDDVEFKIRYVSPAFARKSRLKHTKPKWFRGQQTDDTNQQAWNDDLVDHMLEDWKGVELESNVPAPCTKENKQKLMDLSGSHATFIIEQAQDLSLFDGRDREIERKNSLSSSISN